MSGEEVQLHDDPGRPSRADADLFGHPPPSRRSPHGCRQSIVENAVHRPRRADLPPRGLARFVQEACVECHGGVSVAEKPVRSTSVRYRAALVPEAGAAWKPTNRLVSARQLVQGIEVLHQTRIRETRYQGPPRFHAGTTVYAEYPEKDPPLPGFRTAGHESTGGRTHSESRAASAENHPGISRRDRSSRSRFRRIPADVGKSRQGHRLAGPGARPARPAGEEHVLMASGPASHPLRTHARRGSGSRNPELPVSRVGEPAPARCPPSLAPSQAAARKGPLTRPGSRLRSDADGGGRLPGSCSRMRSFPHAFPYRPPA